MPRFSAPTIFHTLREIEMHPRHHAATLSGGTQGASGSRRRAHGEIAAFAQTRHTYVTLSQCDSTLLTLATF